MSPQPGRNRLRKAAVRAAAAGAGKGLAECAIGELEGGHELLFSIESSFPSRATPAKWTTPICRAISTPRIHPELPKGWTREGCQPSLAKAIRETTKGAS
jgi:hypothetical protein